MRPASLTSKRPRDESDDDDDAADHDDEDEYDERTRMMRLESPASSSETREFAFWRNHEIAAHDDTPVVGSNRGPDITCRQTDR
jgi:hypothetical protein